MPSSTGCAEQGLKLSSGYRATISSVCFSTDHIKMQALDS